MDETLKAVRSKGHVVEDDSPHAMSAVARWTCQMCGRAVLNNRGHWYGSALHEECDA